MNQNTQHTPAPWGWQKFGTEYCLVAQHGMREIILSALPSKQPYNKPCNVVMAEDGILRPINPEHPNAQLIARAPELLKENEQLKEQVGDLTKSVKYFSDLYHDEDKDHKSTKALNAELLEALKQLHETTRKIYPEHWDLRTADSLEYAGKLIAKAQPK